MHTSSMPSSVYPWRTRHSKISTVSRGSLAGNSIRRSPCSRSLVHGFGLATKLQDLSLSPEGLVANIISFNVGVEIGQLLALVGLLVIINAWRATGSFERHANAFNLLLMFAGFALAAYQIAGYYFGAA